MSNRKLSRALLAMTLDERGFPCEAENVRAGVDLGSYEGELQAIGQLLRLGLIEEVEGIAEGVK